MAKKFYNVGTELFTAKDIAKILNVSLGKAYAIMNGYGFPLLKDGRFLYVTREAFCRWLERSKYMAFADKHVCPMTCPFAGFMMTR